MRSHVFCNRYLVFGIVDLGRFPFAVHFRVPIFGLFGIGVGDGGRLVPIFGFGVVGIVDGRVVDPVLGLLSFGVLDLLGRQEIEIGFQFTAFNFRVVD